MRSLSDELKKAGLIDEEERPTLKEQTPIERKLVLMKMRGGKKDGEDESGTEARVPT